MNDLEALMLFCCDPEGCLVSVQQAGLLFVTVVESFPLPHAGCNLARVSMSTPM